MVLTSILILASLLVASTVLAANRYVRAGATGANNGTDWNNAFTAIPTTLARGDTYYIADGSYGNYTVNTVASGATFIWIKKATVADHGTSTGWSDAYGDGQALFHCWQFEAGGAGVDAGYVDINGYSTHVTNNCGFKWTGLSIQEAAFEWHYGSGDWPEMKFQYCEVDGPMKGADMASSAGPPWSYGFLMIPYNGSGYDSTSNTVISHCWIHGVSTPLNDCDGPRYITVEYCHIYDGRVTGEDHGNVFLANGDFNTFRYNHCWNYHPEGIYFVNDTTGWKIYGNVFFDGSTYSRGVELPWDRTHQNMKIYNNTFVNLEMAAIRVMAAAITSGIEIRNNLLVDVGISIESGGGGITLANNVTTNTSIFVNYASKNFRLVNPLPGAAVSGSEFGFDPDGNSRGTDGTWDVGAYEYGGGPITNAAISVSPGNLSFGSVAAGATAQLSFTVRNTGVGTLTGTASVSPPFSIISGGTYNLGSDQSQTVTIRFAPIGSGNYSQMVTFSGAGGAFATVSGVAWTVLPGLSFESTAGTITPPFVASGGYVSQPAETGVADGGLAVYGFTVLNAGSYTISAKVDAPNGSADSLFFNIDAEPSDPQMIWDVSPFTAGMQDRIGSWRGSGTFDNPESAPKVFNLGAGTHQLIVRGREANVKLGTITLVPYSGTSNPPSAPTALRVVATQ